MAEARKCSRCSKPIQTYSPFGLCPECLVDERVARSPAPESSRTAAVAVFEQQWADLLRDELDALRASLRDKPPD